MKILFASSECAPFVKTGGLADVVGALPKEIARRGVDIRVILPLYKSVAQEYRDQMDHLFYFYINLGWRRQYVGIERLVRDGVTFYFVDNEQYFGRDYIYGSGSDEGERFAYFCKAVLEALPQMDFIPDILHCHDWQTGMIPILLKAQYEKLPHYRNIRTIYTIHNLKYQGTFNIGQIEELLSLGAWAYTSENLEFYSACSFMKGGIVFSDKVTTVSPTYAKEIQSPYYGERLDGLLKKRSHDLVGILNGIDTEEYNPATDTRIYATYTADTFEKKRENKAPLQRELGLNEDPNVPLIGMVSRLSGQKGFDLVERVLDEIMATGAQVVVLGLGESKYTDLFGWAQWKYRGRLAACFQMNETLSHRIYAASDMFLMPSMFEPCGLSQMISMRYGTLPIARETGGLRDTVISYDPETGRGNGFTFFNYNAHDMLHVVENAVRMYRESPATIERLAKRAMQGQYGWNQSAGQYIDLYSDLMIEKPGVPEAAAANTAPEAATASEPEAEVPPVAPAPKKRTRKAPEKAEKAADDPAKASAPKKRASCKKVTADVPADETLTETPPAKKPRAPRKKKTESPEK